MDSYDLIVIGTGTAAQVTAARLRRAGRSVAMIDHRPFGGTCALRGCDPKKMLVSGAEAVDWARRMHRRGIVGELRQVSATGIVKRIHFLRIAGRTPRALDYPFEASYQNQSRGGGQAGSSQCLS